MQGRGAGEHGPPDRRVSDDGRLDVPQVAAGVSDPLNARDAVGACEPAEMPGRLRSVLTRKADGFSRTHAVTLAYMGAVHARQGNVEAACGTWAQALDAMDGVHSGRARESVVNMRRVLSPYRNRGIAAAGEIDERAMGILGRVA